MEEARLAILKADLAEQFQRIQKVYQRIDQRYKELKHNPLMIENIAYQLHNLYCAFEDLFKIIADFFENRIEEKTYHTQLLKRMSIEIENLRPRVISEKSFIFLNELRAFRHLFRDAYLYELDPRKIELVLQKALELKELFEEDYRNFIKNLETTK
jgi:hypothetical protein